jgi:hypothetical protein
MMTRITTDGQSSRFRQNKIPDELSLAFIVEYVQSVFSGGDNV